MWSNFRNFSETTTVHGIFEIFHNRHSTLVHYVWSLIFAFCLMLCIWQSTVNIQTYKSFTVMTKESYETDNKPNFPAITLWNKNLIKRSGVDNGITRWMLLQLSTATSDDKDTKKLYTQMFKSCPTDNTTMDKTDQMIYDFATKQKIYVLSTENIMKEFSLSFISKDMNFVKCWINQKVFDCNRIILTSVTEFYFETKDLVKFSINLKPDLAENFITNDNYSVNKYYETTTLSNMLEPVSISQQSVTLLLNVNQDEHCTADVNIYYGAGFQVILHDPRMLPSTVAATALDLSPGYQYNIALKPIYYTRKTEHLGKCLAIYPLYMFPNNTDYLKEFCQLQCKVELIYERCKCLATFLPAAGVAFGQKKGLSRSEVDEILGCSFVDPNCVPNMYTEISKTGIEKICPQCKQQCVETKFNYQTTVTKFPPKHLSSYYTTEVNGSNEAKFRQNYLLLNVFYESTMVNVNEETQVFTLNDLFIFIGNNIGLFLGMSFMTFGEIILFIYEQFLSCLFKLKRRKVKSSNVVRIEEINFATGTRKKCNANARTIYVQSTAVSHN